MASNVRKACTKFHATHQAKTITEAIDMVAPLAETLDETLRDATSANDLQKFDSGTAEAIWGRGDGDAAPRGVSFEVAEKLAVNGRSTLPPDDPYDDF